MEFWSRLIAGTSLSPSTANKASSANNPEKRLARLRREYNQLLQIWRSATNLSRDQDAVEGIRGAIQELTAILSDETRRPSPHPCISFASSKQIFVPIGKIATTSYNEPIIREAVAFFSTLIESEEEDFLESEAFSNSLMNLLVRITGANSMRLSADTEVEVVELAFSIAAKIRLQPEILPVWFTTHSEEADDEQRDAHEKFAGKTHKEDFPLFYLLIDCIHQDGRVGDFARTGLLYVIESASTSLALEQWLVESDLATLMATGLGALYSQLSRKLVIDHIPDELPPILALSDYQHPVATTEIVSSTSVDFQGHMDTFLSHLVFWQDVLEHCKSVEVKQTLLEHFQVIFLQQLLYPSLLESSDIDGGSSVAVLTYLRRILESLDHPDMIHLILHYLLALPDTAPVRTNASRAVSAARRRKSMDLAAMMASQSDDQATPALFNLVDLILGCLRSESQQTIAVTLQLVSVILRRHHRYAVSTLLRTSRHLTEGTQRTIGAHEREMEFILSLASEIGGDDDFDEAYERHIKDAMALLESHPCSQILITPKAANGNTKLPGAQASIPGGPRDVRSHTLKPDDPMLKTILGMLETFFVNPIETNLCLTETIVDLAACGFMSIEGWLVPDPIKYTYEETAEAQEDAFAMTESTTKSPEDLELVQLHAIRVARRTPTWPPTDFPSFLSTLSTLVSQTTIYRSQIPRFDDLLQQRRHLLHTQPEAPPPSAVPIRPAPRSSFDSSTSRSASPPPNKQTAFDSLAQRIFPDFSTPSRSSSPRGRRSQDQHRGSIPHGTATPTSTPSRIAPPQFPMGGAGANGLDPPSRGSSRAFSSSPLRGSDTAPTAVSRGLASQAAAFAEVDKAILARRVGIPTLRGELVPAPFPNLSDKVGGGAGEGDSAVAVDDGVDGRSNGSASASGGDSEFHDAVDALVDEGDANVETQDDGEARVATIEELTHGDEEEQAHTRDETAKAASFPVSVSVSHLLTNIILLQDFLLEIAAVVQVRAGLFAEVRFT